MKKNIITMVNWAILNKWDTNILEMGLFKSETDASAYLFHSLLIEGYRKKYQEQRDTDSKVKILENINECFLRCENPIVLLKGNKTLREFNLRNGTLINID